MNPRSRRIVAVTRRQWWSSKRAPFRVFDIAVWPVLDVILWGSLGVSLTRTTGDPAIPALLAGIILFHVLFQTQIGLTGGFLEETTWTRNLLNVLVTPVSEVEYMLGVALYSLAKLVLALVAVSLTALVLFGFGITSEGFGLIPIAVSLLLSGSALGLLVVGIVLRYGPSAEILTWGFNYVAMAVSGVFYPVDALPGALRWLGRIVPTTYSFDALRTLVATGSLPGRTVVTAIGGGLLALILAGVYTGRMLRVFRRRGYVTRFS